MTRRLFEVPGYQILEWIGEGTFGTVYRARQRSTNRHVAIKLLRITPDDTQSARRIARFHRETRLCAKLRHPYIVQLVDAGMGETDQLYAVFEYVEGETLQQRLKRCGPLPMDVFKTVMGQVLEALAYAHQEGITHRDLKPGNIMVTTVHSQTFAKVLDFGTGGYLPESKHFRDDLTLASESLGTPSYAAPEQLRGAPPNPRSDIYAWGLVCLECLTGTTVMTGSSVAEIIHRQLLADAIDLPTEIADHPLGALLRQALAKSPRDRSGDASQLLSQYRAISFDDLAGKIRSGGESPSDTDKTTEGFPVEKRWVTVLCCSLGIGNHDDPVADLGILASWQHSHRRLCADVVLDHGGFQAGSLGDFQMFYFGFPQSSDVDARLAARAALDLAEAIKRNAARNASPSPLEFRAGIHSGYVQIDRGEMPSGATSHLALQLAASARVGQILISGQARDRLSDEIDAEVSLPSVFSPVSRIYSLRGLHPARTT